MKTVSIVLTATVAAALLVAGCSIGGVGRRLAVKNLGKEKIVEKNGGRPDWAFEKPMFVKGGILYSSAMFTDSPNLGKGLEVATKLAQAKLAESIRLRLKDDFTYASEGLDVASTIPERILNTTTDELTMHGLFQTKLHYEKKRVQTLGGIAYRYDCFALAEITQENYQRAVADAINGNLPPPVSERFLEKVEERQRIFFRLGDKPADKDVTKPSED